MTPSERRQRQRNLDALAQWTPEELETLHKAVKLWHSGTATCFRAAVEWLTFALLGAFGWMLLEWLRSKLGLNKEK